MFQGMAKTTRKTYDSAQRKFLKFCHWSQCLNANGSPLLVSEWTFMLFTTNLLQTIKASSIKACLAGVRSLHIENGFANPLSNCLRLEQVIRGIKRLQGISTRKRFPCYVDSPVPDMSSVKFRMLRRCFVLGSMLYQFFCLPSIWRISKSTMMSKSTSLLTQR